MNSDQALKIIQKALSPTHARLAFGVGLYEAGCRDPWAVRNYAEQKRIEKALAVLVGPKQLEMFRNET